MAIPSIQEPDGDDDGLETIREEKGGDQSQREGSGSADIHVADGHSRPPKSGAVGEDRGIQV